MDPFTDGNADEWEEGSLPAAPTVPFFTQQDFVDVIPQQNHENASPNSNQNQHATSNRHVGSPNNGQKGRFNGPGTGSTPYREPRPYRPEIGGIPSRGRGIRGRQAQHNGLPVENAAYASYLRKEPAGGEYTFSHIWKQQLSDLHGDKARIWAEIELNRLSRQTGTFIATPPNQDSTARIWGDNDQVTFARAGLREFESAIRNEHVEQKKDLGKWKKISALDARKEHREERRAKVEELIAQHGKLESSAEHKFEFWMPWPSQSLEFAQISPAKIEGLQKNFRCKIDYESATSFVRIMAHQERDLLQVVNRIVNLVKEIIAELNNVAKANLHQLPSKSTYGSTVRLEKNDSLLVTPILEGLSQSMVDSKEWECLVRNNRRSNRKKIAHALERCLKSLRLSQKHVQMRVGFGQLAFKQYRLPLDGSKQYDFGEFCTMVSNDRTILELPGLLCGADTDTIVGRCESHPMFVNPTESYSVHIDFQEAGKATTLRLKKKFTVSHDYKDAFSEGHEWLEISPGSEGSLLEINMLDFEDSDWQMTMNATSFFAGAGKSQQHNAFETNVTFKPTRDDIRGKPKRRVFFKPGGPRPILVTELMTVTYDLKGTEGKLELTRTDDYQQTMFGTAAGPPISRMSFSYFYPEWDSKLGQYAYLSPGEQVDWHPSLSTFFLDPNSEGKPNGLKKFMEEVREIQQVLAGKPAQADDAHTEAVLNDLPNGVGNASY